jgi:hypothetical protein
MIRGVYIWSVVSIICKMVATATFAEDELGRKWDRCLTDTMLKTGNYVCLQFLLTTCCSRKSWLLLALPKTVTLISTWLAIWDVYCGSRSCTLISVFIFKKFIWPEASELHLQATVWFEPLIQTKSYVRYGAGERVKISLAYVPSKWTLKSNQTNRNYRW